MLIEITLNLTFTRFQKKFGFSFQRISRPAIWVPALDARDRFEDGPELIMRSEVDLDQGQVEPWPVFLDYLSYSISNVIVLLPPTMKSLGLERKVPHIKVALRWRHQQRAHRRAIMYQRVLIERQDSYEANKQCNIKRLIWAKVVAFIRGRWTFP